MDFSLPQDFDSQIEWGRGQEEVLLSLGGGWKVERNEGHCQLVSRAALSQRILLSRLL